ncbi:MAG: rhomboid family intramembrane serine protease [Hyphomicrobiaceae bacterium]|nr:rhomboid family intramembrane serine protease [Hyphomicrobiaceae bacterium]
MFPLRDNVYRTHDPIVVWLLIAANVAAFLYELTLNPQQLEVFIAQHGLVPARYFVPSWGWRIGLSPLDVTPFLTNTFLHGGFLHIIMNLWTLWIFGPALEDRLGPMRFAALYLLAGILASLTHAAFNATSTIPALGASGAIAGVIAAYAVRFPFAWIRVLVLIVIIPVFFSVPAIVFAGIWFLTQLLQGTSELFMPFAGSGIAWWAHIGGFLAGSMLLLVLEDHRTPAVRYHGGPWER